MKNYAPSPFLSSFFSSPRSFGLTLLSGSRDLDLEEDDADEDLPRDAGLFLFPLDLELLLLLLPTDLEVLLLLDRDELLEEDGDRLRSREREGDLLSLPRSLLPL